MLISISKKEYSVHGLHTVIRPAAVVPIECSTTNFLLLFKLE